MLSRLRRRLRLWLGIQNNTDYVNDLRERIDDVDRVSGATIDRHGRLRREVEELGILATTMRDVLGPIWTTAQGHSAPMVMLSSSHLRNILEGGFARTVGVREFAERELERRSNDADWRRREAEGQKAPTIDDMLAIAAAKADSFRRRNQTVTGRTVSQRTNVMGQIVEPEGPVVEIDYAQLEARTLVNMLRQALYEKNVAQRRTSNLEQELNDIIETGG